MLQTAPPHFRINFFHEMEWTRIQERCDLCAKSRTKVSEQEQQNSKPYLQDFGRFLSRFFVPLLLSQLNLCKLGSQIFLPVKKQL
jgi:hypothetical protein